MVWITCSWWFFRFFFLFLVFLFFLEFFVKSIVVYYHIVLLRGNVCVYIASLTRSLIVDVLVPSQENKRSCTYVSLWIFNWIFWMFFGSVVFFFSCFSCLYIVFKSGILFWILCTLHITFFLNFVSCIHVIVFTCCFRVIMDNVNVNI